VIEVAEDSFRLLGSMGDCLDAATGEVKVPIGYLKADESEGIAPN
jgi:hypothetical protein